MLRWSLLPSFWAGLQHIACPSFLKHSVQSCLLHRHVSCVSADAATYGTGEVSFHSGWTFHQAAGNNTDAPREVFTIIFMDKDMIMAEPINHNQRLDHDRSAPIQCLYDHSMSCVILVHVVLCTLILLGWHASAQAGTLPTVLNVVSGIL